MGPCAENTPVHWTLCPGPQYACTGMLQCCNLQCCTCNACCNSSAVHLMHERISVDGAQPNRHGPDYMLRMACIQRPSVVLRPNVLVINVWDCVSCALAGCLQLCQRRAGTCTGEAFVANRLRRWKKDTPFVRACNIEVPGSRFLASVGSISDCCLHSSFRSSILRAGSPGRTRDADRVHGAPFGPA